VASFNEANQARLALKMRLSQLAWYSSSWLEMDAGDWIVVVNVNGKVDDRIRKEVSPVFNGVEVRTTNNGK